MLIEGAVSYTLIPPILFFLSRRGLSLRCYLAAVVRELEEYPIFSDFPLDGVAGSQSGLRGKGFLVCSDDPREPA